MSNTELATMTDAATDLDESHVPADESSVEDTADYDAEHTDTESEELPTPIAESDSQTSCFAWKDFLVFVVLPAVLVALGGLAGYLKFQDASVRSADAARQQSVHAAVEDTIAMLSYSPDNVESALKAAEDRLTGPFRDSYTSLVKDVVIPGAKQQKISATATVPAAASISTSPRHAVVMVYINQATIIGADAPTDTASVVQVTLDKVGNRWLVSGFEPK